MNLLLDQIDSLLTVSSSEAVSLLIVLLATIASLLTLYNAAKLRTGILAMATYTFGIGMLSLAGGFFLVSLPSWMGGADDVRSVYQILFVLGFIFLAWGSFQIYKMSRIK